MKSPFFLFVVSLSCTSLLAQSIPFDSDRWQIQAQESKVEQYLGRQSLYLKGGAATLKQVAFLNGIIEFDIAFAKQRSFAGLTWRVIDDQNYEYFYLRPHQSGKPDANQYTPVFNGLSAWQLYHGQGYGAAIDYDFGQWMHVKIVVSGKQADVYVKDMNKPLFFIHDMKREITSGSIAFRAGNFAPVWFSNLTFQRLDKPELQGTPPNSEPTSASTIKSWLVSNVIAETQLQGKSTLSADDKANLTWQRLRCEPSGLANLARLHGRDQEMNTVFARVVINSSREQVKQIDFGYSDRVRVYLNDRLLYSGTNRYQSRDFRYLGTIGYFDSIYLNLQKGDNELWFAVSEDFGGWGIQCKFENMEGIIIE